MKLMSACYKNNTTKITKDDLFTNLYEEEMNIDSRQEKYEIICFNRKKKISYRVVLENNSINCKADEIMNSHMVVIRTNAFFKSRVIQMLCKICVERKNFAPIVFSEDNDIIFFPKLRYQDGYLIKGILENTMKGKQYQVAYGSKDLIII